MNRYVPTTYSVICSSMYSKLSLFTRAELPTQTQQKRRCRNPSSGQYAPCLIDCVKLCEGDESKLSGVVKHFIKLINIRLILGNIRLMTSSPNIIGGI